MTNINNLVKISVNKQKFKIPLALEGAILPKYITEHHEFVELLQEEEETEKMKLNKRTKPELKDGQYAIPYRIKNKERRFNPRTKRMKNFKITKWYITDIPPEERSLKNLPRYAGPKKGKGEPKVRFQDWLQISRPPISKNANVHSVGKGCDGKWYGWSHRAIHGFYVGEEIKSADVIGNKYTYSDDIQKKYWEIEKKHGSEAADVWDKKMKEGFKPYIIKTDAEAQEHAIRFAKDVS